MKRCIILANGEIDDAWHRELSPTLGIVPRGYSQSQTGTVIGINKIDLSRP